MISRAAAAFSALSSVSGGDGGSSGACLTDSSFTDGVSSGLGEAEALSKERSGMSETNQDRCTE